MLPLITKIMSERKTYKSIQLAYARIDSKVNLEIIAAIQKQTFDVRFNMIVTFGLILPGPTSRPFCLT